MQNVDFFDSFRTLLFRSKKHYFLSRRSKNVSFWLCLLKKNISIFWQKPWTNLFGKMSIFSNLLEVQFCGLKSIFFLSRISKNVSFWLFLLKKNIWEKGRFFDKKPWTNPFAKCWFFFYFARTSLLGSRKHSFLHKILKNVCFWRFLLKKKYIRKRSIFWQKPWTNRFTKCRFF